MQIREVMTSPVATIHPQATLLQAAREMSDRETAALLVLEGDKPRGIVTGSDVTRQVLEDDNARVSSRRVDEIMNPKTAACFEDSEVKEVRNYMEKHGFARLLVFNRNREVVGLAETENLRKP